MSVRIASAVLVASVSAFFAARSAAQPADTPPQALWTTPVSELDYPLESLTANEEGNVVLNVDVDASGLVTNTQVLTSSGFPRLDQQTMAIAKARWHFAPATRNGSAVAANTHVVITWTLPLSPAGDAYVAPTASTARLARPAAASPGLSMYVREQGVVGVKYLPGANGAPASAQVAVTSGVPRLDAAALRLLGGASAAAPPGPGQGDWRDVTVAFTAISRAGANAPLHCYARPILAHESMLVRAEPVFLYYSQMNMEPVMMWHAQPAGQWTAIWVQVSNTGAVTDALLDTAKGWMRMTAPVRATITKGRHYPQDAGASCWYYDPIAITG